VVKKWLDTKINENSSNFQNRSDISHKLEHALACDTLLVTGAKSHHVQTMENVFNHCDKTK
jgi:hypothetical protein